VNDAAESIPSATGDPGHRGQQRHLLLLLVLAAAAFRVALLALPRLVRWDEPIYLWLGRSLWTGAGFTSPAGHAELHHAPLQPILLGATYVLTGNPELAGEIWFVLWGALLPLPVFALARRLSRSLGVQGDGGALLAAALAAVMPGLSSAVLFWGTLVEPLFCLLVATAAWLAGLAADRDHPLLYGAAGVTTGIAYLTRPEGVVWLAALVAWWLLAWALDGQLRRPVWIGSRLGAAAAGFALAAAPYVLYLHQHTGQWMLTGKVSITYEIGEAVEKGDPVLYDQVTGTVDPATGDTRWASSGQGGKGLLERLRDDPAAFLGRLGRNALHLVRSSLTSPLFSAALLLPVAWAWLALPWNRRRVREEALLAAAALPVASFLTFHVQQRFFAPALPVLLVWTGTALWAALWEWRGRLGWARRGLATAALLLALAGYLAWAHGRVIERGVLSQEPAHAAAGRWLRGHSPPEARIMSRDLAISLYAERGYVGSPRLPWEPFLEFGRRRGATHLVVDEQEARVLRPWLGFLLERPPAGIELIATARDHHGRTLVFRLH
jgi:4-amino-4-deoxy-L-arabinose transferase-like glycosyltransferase